MSTPRWVVELAERFWAATGVKAAGGSPSPPPFPRDLRGAMAFALPLGLDDPPRLCIDTVNAWLARRDLPCRLGGRNRPLRACLMAYGGAGLVLLDGADPPAEQRFSLAHEVAHFLVDYWQPRERAVARLGPTVLKVLDGQRPPTAAERVDALLAQVPLGVHVHLMDRTPDGHPAGLAEDAAERRADLLALELLAPRDAVEAALGALGGPRRHAEIAALLVEQFGLPPAIAAAYAATFAPAAPGRSFLRQLGLAP